MRTRLDARIADRGVRQVDFLTLVLDGISLACPLPVPIFIIAHYRWKKGAGTIR